MIRNVKLITGCTYFSMLFLGISMALIGAVSKDIGLSAYEIGILLTFQNIGVGIGVTVSGALSDDHEKSRVLVVGGLILAAAYLGFFATSLFWVNLLIMLCIGIGTGSFEGVTDAMLLDMHRERAGLHININHLFVTLGSIVIALYLIFLDLNWRNATIQTGIVILLLVLVFIPVRLPPPAARIAGLHERLRLLATERIVAVLFAAMTLCVSVQMGTLGILTTYLVDLRGFSLTAAKMALVIFLSGMGVGRIIIGFMTPREKMPRWIMTLFALSVVLFAALFFLDLGFLTFVIAFMAGLSLSAIVPLMIAYAGLTYPQAPGTVMGSLKVAIPVGGIMMPFLTSIVTRAFSLEAALALYPAAFAAALLLLWTAGYSARPVGVLETK